MTIFFAQLASLFVYILMCKLFIACKKACSSPVKLAQIENNDPFWALLTKGVADFFAYDNQVMAITILQLTNMFVSVWAAINIFNDD